ncbi:J domain-containing protein (plasmid) [Microtetraspora malaysiensis]|uniref:J domain-containing protein n=1 Tax=Microtetraspora malaysiensis TaxID=161358 RepID=UPI003D8AB43C
MLSVADLKPCKGSKHKQPCGKKVRWTRTQAGLTFPVDPDQHPDGNTAVWRDVHGVLRSRTITAAQPLVPPEKRMMPHAATCTGAPRVETPPPRPPKASPPAGHLYDVLGVPRDATMRDIRSAYRRLARELHPDANPDPAAVDRFKEVTKAYDVLYDPDQRRTYDATGRPPRPR